MTFLLFAEQMLNGLQFGIMLFLMAAGLTLVFGVMGLINLAHGSLYMIGAFAAAWVAGLTGSFVLALMASLAAAAAAGALIELTVIRRLYKRDHLDQVLATFALILILSEGTRWVFGSFPLYLDVPSYLSGPVTLPGGIQYPLYRLAIIVAGLVVAGGLFALIARTRIGIQIRAGEADREMIAALGIDISRLYTLVFALGAALAGLAGALVGAGWYGRACADPGLRGDRHWRDRVDQGRAGGRVAGGTDRYDGRCAVAAVLRAVHGPVGGDHDRCLAGVDADLYPDGGRADCPPVGPVRERLR